MSHLRYNQAAVNTISITAEIAMYLPVPFFGYLCDRYGPRPPSLLAGGFFGAGYLIAALAYHSGPPEALGGNGWPFWFMVIAFIGVGMGTSCMYLSAVTTCAKNFGRGKYKGIALAIPIAAFGLSGMWQSQVGERLLYERRADGSRGEVDVFRFFIFLACLLFGAGMLGSVALKIVDESDMIEEAIDELEQSGLLDENDYFRRAAQHHGYGTTAPADLSDSQVNFLRSEAELMAHKAAEERARKTWLLNAETRRFVNDHTMWLLAAGFFLVTGPGETFINNLGTVLGTLYSRDTPPTQIPTTAATHVSIVAATSTVARLLTGTLTDLFAPAAPPKQHLRGPRSRANSAASLPTPQTNRFTLSRLWFLLLFGLLSSLGQILLASGAIQNHAERFWVVSALIGAGYGAVFSLTPIIVSVTWGVENFGTNWGIVAIFPAGGAAVWSIVYSAVYQAGSTSGEGEDRMCYGVRCYAPTFWAMACSVWFACVFWVLAWKGPGGWAKRGIAV
jgi:MFS family permease